MILSMVFVGVGFLTFDFLLRTKMAASKHVSFLNPAKDPAKLEGRDGLETSREFWHVINM